MGNCKGLVLLRIPLDYDLVLELDSLGSRRKFIAKLETFLTSHKKHFSIGQANRDVMLAKAETKERRQKKLEQVSASLSALHKEYVYIYRRSVYCICLDLRQGDSCSGYGLERFRAALFLFLSRYTHTESRYTYIRVLCCAIVCSL